MQTSNDCVFENSFSAFKKLHNQESQTFDFIYELQGYLEQTIEKKKKIPIKPIREYQGLKNQITKAFMDLVYSVQIKMNSQKTETIEFRPLLAKDQISLALFKSLCLMSEHELFETSCKYHCELAKSMLLEKGLLETFRLCLLSEEGKTHKNIRVTFEQLDEILENLLSNGYRKKFLDNIYKLHSGTATSIERIGFEQNLKCIITNIGRIFTEKNNLITRNLKNVQKSKFITDIVSHSVKTICNYKNDEFINDEIGRITLTIFENKSQMSRTDFRQKMQRFLNSLNSNSNSLKSKAMKMESSQVVHILFLYLDLVRVQTLMLGDPLLKSNIQNQQEVDSTNFYTLEMQKLLKKSYNGDESCNCKKCNCIRRNRESAKLSQERKRNAVEQLAPMQNRIYELERVNRQLMEENLILRGMVQEFNAYTVKREVNFYSAFEEMSKILHNR